MQFEPLGTLARSRQERLRREAEYRRALRRAHPAPGPARLRLARAMRVVGYFALSLGDALARSR